MTNCQEVELYKIIDALIVTNDKKEILQVFTTDMEKFRKNADIIRETLNDFYRCCKEDFYPSSIIEVSENFRSFKLINCAKY